MESLRIRLEPDVVSSKPTSHSGFKIVPKVGGSLWINSLCQSTNDRSTKLLISCTYPPNGKEKGDSAHFFVRLCGDCVLGCPPLSQRVFQLQLKRVAAPFSLQTLTRCTRTSQHDCVASGLPRLLSVHFINEMSLRSLMRPRSCSPMSQTCNVPGFSTNPPGIVRVPAARWSGVRNIEWRP